MMSEDDNYTSKIRILAIGLVAFFVTLILFLYILTRGQNPIHVTNMSSGDSSKLSYDEIEAMRLQLNDFLTDDVASADIAIRWATFYQDGDNKYFLVDIEKLQQTYVMTFIEGSLYVECPEIGQSRYPNSYCYIPELDGESSADEVFGDSLPYHGMLNDIEYYVEVSDDDQQTLIIHVYDCRDIDLELAITEDLFGLIRSKGTEPDIFEYEFEYNDCSVE